MRDRCAAHGARIGEEGAIGGRAAARIAGDGWVGERRAPSARAGSRPAPRRCGRATTAAKRASARRCGGNRAHRPSPVGRCGPAVSAPAAGQRANAEPRPAVGGLTGRPVAPERHDPEAAHRGRVEQAHERGAERRGRPRAWSPGPPGSPAGAPRCRGPTRTSAWVVVPRWASPAAVGGALDRGDVDVRGQVLPPDVRVRVVVDLVADVRPQRPVASADRVVQLGRGVAVVDEQQRRRGSRPAAAPPRPSRRARGRSRRVWPSASVDALGGEPRGQRRRRRLDLDLDEARRRAEVDARSRARRVAAPTDAVDRQRVERPRWRGRRRRSARSSAVRSSAASKPGRREPAARGVDRAAIHLDRLGSGSAAASAGSLDAETAEDRDARARPSPAPCSRTTNGSGRSEPLPDVARTAARASPRRSGGPRARSGSRRRGRVAPSSDAVVAALRVVQRELHEPGEGHRPVALGSRRGSARRAPSSSPTRVEVGGRVATQAGRQRPSARAPRRPSASRSPGPTSVWPPSRTGIGASRPRPRQVAQPRVGDPLVRAAGPMRTGPRRAASRASSAPEPMRQQDPAVDDRARRRAAPGASPSDPGPSRSSSAPRTERRPAAGRRRASAGRAPRRAPASATRSRARARPGVVADVRPATRSSAAGSPATARTPVEPRRRPRRESAAQRRRPAAAEQHEVERAVDVDAEPPAAAAGRRPRSPASRPASAGGRCRMAGPAVRRARATRRRSPRRPPSSGCWRARARSAPAAATRSRDGRARSPAGSPRNPGRRARPVAPAATMVAQPLPERRRVRRPATRSPRPSAPAARNPSTWRSGEAGHARPPASGRGRRHVARPRGARFGP